MNDQSKFVGRYSTYPDLTGKRIAEGGLRTLPQTTARSHSDKTVTIITVCWNSSKTIEQSIKSVLSQTYANIEYIIVDGASSDNTLDILKKYASEIEYYVSEPDEGLYFAMNKGLELAKGEHVLFLNSDDWYAPDTVQTLMDALDYSGCEFVSALAKYIEDDTGNSRVLRAMPFDHSQLLRMSLRHELMLLPAALYEKLGPYDTRYKILSDREYAARLFHNNVTHYEVQRALLNFRTSGISHTNTELLATEQDLILKQYFPFLNDKERSIIGSPQKTSAEAIIKIANKHPSQSTFRKACHALLLDYKSNQTKWAATDLSKLTKKNRGQFPKVSVILPFYKAENTIDQCLRSIQKQNLREFEVVCIDDKSVDDSRSVVDAYCRRDKRFRLLTNETNLGLGASRNKGVAAAKGEYIFHIDPDDTIPQNALETLYNIAVEHQSTIVKGAFRAQQGLHNAVGGDVIKYPCNVKDKTVINTSLAYTPELLHSTEGHWSCLYEANFARKTPYPRDLKMGQDSIFLTMAFASAPKISLTPEVIYHYQANAESAMNSFSARKFFDMVEWRRRAWRLLKETGHKKLGERLLFAYWDIKAFEAIDDGLSEDDRSNFYQKLKEALTDAQYPGNISIKNTRLRARFDDLTNSAHTDSEAAAGAELQQTPLDAGVKVATLSTKDLDGAGLGSQRRVEALRAHGVDAEIFCLIKKTDNPVVHQLDLSCLRYEVSEGQTLNAFWRSHVQVSSEEHPGLFAREFFSKAESVVNFSTLAPIFEAADIVHMHWVVGMFDYEEAGEHLKDKPVVWTLADMNAITGGCHYSEGCDGFHRDCSGCPLLSGSNFAHGTWSKKKRAYASLKNLHIICPSEWLGEQVRQSSLLGDRPVHVIPNALPVDRFQPTNKLVARKRLDLPLEKKLIVFGATSLNNDRKGGDILVDAITYLEEQNCLEDVEGVFFGDKSLELPIEAHNFGIVSSEEKLSLIYAAADVFAFPSKEDNAPLTVVESLLSGTPVVGFPVGNVPELIDHKDTGYIARYLDMGDFADGLIWALSEETLEDSILRSMRCHFKAKNHNDPGIAAQRHLELYRSLMRAETNSNE